MKKFILKDWLWVLYPVAVATGIFFGLSMLFGNGGDRLDKFTGARKELEVQKAELLRLQMKEQILQTVDTERETTTLVRLTEAMPAAKKVWLLVSELNAAGTEAVAAMTDLEGSADNVKDASVAATPIPVKPGMKNTLELQAKYELGEYEQVKTILAKLDKMLPLVKVNKFSFNGGVLEIDVEGAWSNWNKVAAEALNPLPDVINPAMEMEAKLMEFESIPQSDPNSGDFIFTVNPF